MRIFLYHLSGVIVMYLLFAFVQFDMFWIAGGTGVRLSFVAVVIVLQLLMASIYIEGTPKFLQTPTHEEKKSSIRKYIGELREELNLHAEARELLKRIDELRKSKS